METTAQSHMKKPSLWGRLMALVTRFNAMLILFTLVIAIWASLSTYIQQQHNDAQDKAFRENAARQVKANTEFNHCIKGVVAQLTGALPPIRLASAERNAALRAAMIGTKDQPGLGYLLRQSLTDAVAHKPPGDPIPQLRALNKTFDAFETADEHLAAVLLANPYPEMPKKACELPITFN